MANDKLKADAFRALVVTLCKYNIMDAEEARMFVGQLLLYETEIKMFYRDMDALDKESPA